MSVYFNSGGDRDSTEGSRIIAAISSFVDPLAGNFFEASFFPILCIDNTKGKFLEHFLEETLHCGFNKFVPKRLKRELFGCGQNQQVIFEKTRLDYLGTIVYHGVSQQSRLIFS